MCRKTGRPSLRKNENVIVRKQSSSSTSKLLGRLPKRSLVIKRLSRDISHVASFEEDAFENALYKTLSNGYEAWDSTSLDQIIVPLLHGRRMTPGGSLEDALWFVVENKESDDVFVRGP